MTQSVQINETQAFLETLDGLPPTAATACAGWTVHEITAHMAAGADEIARLFEAYGEGLPVPATRGWEEREAPYRAMDDPALRRQLFTASARMASAMGAVFSNEPDAVIPFTNMPMKAASFAMHSRSECAIHRWDMVGDDEVSWQLLSQPEMTQHAVNLLGPLLLSRGCAGVAPASPFSARLRTAGAAGHRRAPWRHRRPRFAGAERRQPRHRDGRCRPPALHLGPPPQRPGAHHQHAPT